MPVVGQFYCSFEDRLKTADRVEPLREAFPRAATDPKKRFRCLDCGSQQVVRVATDDNDDHDIFDKVIPEFASVRQ